MSDRRRIRSTQWLPVIESTANALRDYLTKQRMAELSERALGVETGASDE